MAYADTLEFKQYQARQTLRAEDYVEGIDVPIGDRDIDYIGMSKLDLEELADNHLNWQTKKDRNGKPYTGHQMRYNIITEQYKDAKFRQVVSRSEMTLRQALKLETRLINKHCPKLNQDYTTLSTKIYNLKTYGNKTDEQIEEILDTKGIYGIYGVFK